ncbi:hypothetical protein [Paludibaculum fermentans]|uniref:hypothetical protein n=1 Tax=Paludibaculum fermentans TaxID=1473598 RepID=UPI003EBB309A
MTARALQVCLLAMVLALVIWSAAPDLSGPVPARQDEVCTVCYGTVGSSGVAYFLNGVRYAVHKDEAPIFLNDPQGYAKRFNEHQRPNRSSLVWGGGLSAFVVALIVIAARKKRMQRAAG